MIYAPRLWRGVHTKGQKEISTFWHVRREGNKGMNIKKMKVQLMATAASVLISGVALTSATYAWYAQNNSVRADGLSISAMAEGVGFEITNEKNSDGTTPNFTAGTTTSTVKVAEKATLIPIHPDNLTAYTTSTDAKGVAKWHHAFSDDYDDANVDATTDEFTMSTVDLSKGYGICKNDKDQTFALAAEFYLRLNPGSTGANMSLKDIKATNVKITAADNNMGKCVYLVVAGPNGAYEISTSDVITGETKLKNISTESGSLISSLSADSNPARIIVYAFFDGQDADCKSSNFDPSEISISLDFAGTQESTNTRQSTEQTMNTANSTAQTQPDNSTSQNSQFANSNTTTFELLGRFFNRNKTR